MTPNPNKNKKAAAKEQKESTTNMNTTTQPPGSTTVDAGGGDTAAMDQFAQMTQQLFGDAGNNNPQFQKFFMQVFGIAQEMTKQIEPNMFEQAMGQFGSNLLLPNELQQVMGTMSSQQQQVSNNNPPAVLDSQSDTKPASNNPTTNAVNVLPPSPPKIVESESETELDESSGARTSGSILPRTDDLHYQLNVKLEDLYKGKRKRLTLTRKNFTKERTLFDEKKTLVVPIAPGMYEGQQIRFKREADHLPDHEPGDVIITIKENEHAVFDREDQTDLSIMRQVSLSEIYKLKQRIRHLDGRIIEFETGPKDVLCKSEAFLRKLSGEGMPYYADPENRKGDLYIHFNLNMPDELTPEQIGYLQIVAPPHEYDEEDISNIPEEELASASIIAKQLEILTDEDLQKLHGRYDDDFNTLYDDEEHYFDSGESDPDSKSRSSDSEDSESDHDDAARSDNEEEEAQVQEVPEEELPVDSAEKENEPPPVQESSKTKSKSKSKSKK